MADMDDRSESRDFDSGVEDLPLIELESLEGAFSIQGEVPPDLQKRLHECFPDDQRFHNPFGRYLAGGLDRVLIKRPDVELHADIMEENRKMMSGEIVGKLPWVVIPAHLRFCADVLGSYFRKMNTKIANIAISNAEQLKDRRGQKIYVDFVKLFNHSEINKPMSTALQKVAYQLLRKFKDPEGKADLKQLPLLCKKDIRDSSLEYWIMDFQRELTENEVMLWIRSVVDDAKSKSAKAS